MLNNFTKYIFYKANSWIESLYDDRFYMILRCIKIYVLNNFIKRQ
jgi:hypothetical protein